MVLGTTHVQVRPRGPVTRPPTAGLGMRRIRWVRVEVKGDGTAVCQVAGIGHRLPVVRRVSLGTALALAAEGVPWLVRSTPAEPPLGSSAG